jgi:UDP-2,3-diacylglucosamine pyrophosphatase LpxH
MARAYFIVSDLHLCDIEEHADGWKAYKSARFVVDRALFDAVVSFLDRTIEDERVVVLNGDVIDFDLVTAAPTDPPWPVSGAERRRGMAPTRDKSAWKLQRVLDDHPDFLAMLVRVLAEGCPIVYVMGNHDREFHFDAVQRVLREAVASRAGSEGVTIDLELLSFEPWFYCVPGEIYVEHGQQYDYYTSFRYILDPTVPGARHPTLALPMGNLSNRELMSEMGFFNPHSSDYILNVYRYIAHWLRHYAFSRRGIAIRFLVGSIVVLLQLLRNKSAVQRHPPDNDRLLAELANRIGLPEDTVRALDRLKRQPITNRWYRVMREFWIDRIIVAILMTGGTIILALSPVALWVKLMVPLSSFPLLFLIYEWFAHGETVFHAENEAAEYARAIGRLVAVRIVTFGHSHRPMILPVAPGLTYVNTGTWAPVYSQNATHELEHGLNNVLEVRFEDDAPMISLTSVPR